MQCEDSDFKGKYQHIVTGALRFTKNIKLKKVFTKGPKYRENNNISLERAKACIMKGLNNCINTWHNKHGVNKSVLTEWKHKVNIKINEKIKIPSNNTSRKYYKNVLQQKEPLHISNNIHNEFDYDIG